MLRFREDGSDQTAMRSWSPDTHLVSLLPMEEGVKAAGLSSTRGLVTWSELLVKKLEDRLGGSAG